MLSPLATKLKTLLERHPGGPYSVIGPMVGVHHRSQSFHAALGELVVAGSASLAKKVWNKKTGMPGPGYYALCARWGIAP